MAPDRPCLSVVVPAVDEAEALPRLLSDLAAQREISLEVVVADGGSRDGTPHAALAAARAFGLACRVVACPPGRGVQMNRGARAAAAADLLFLHADTRLPAPDLLARAKRRMARERAARGHHAAAGRFRLRFRRTRPGHRGAYYFYEAKTALARPGCSNGDQGLWLSRSFFEALGGFDEADPFLEDVRVGRRLDAAGAWVVFPHAVHTSARRFEEEGLYERQALNALILVAEELGLRGFFRDAVAAYRCHGRAGRLALGPFLRSARQTLRSDGGRAALRRWARVGRFAADNAWQLAFARDCARNRALGYPPGDGPRPALRAYDRWWAPVAATRPGCAAAACAAALWLYAAPAGVWHPGTPNPG